jgi:hypothetical protein
MRTPNQKLKQNQDLELYGPWIGQVVDNADKEKEGKISVKIPELLGKDVLLDVRPFFPAHTWEIPQIGQFTKITFRHLSRNLPCWEGAWWPSDKRPPAMDGDQKKHTVQVVNKANEPLWTVTFNETNNTALIKSNKSGTFIEFKGDDKTMNIWCDKSGDGSTGADTATIFLNGEPLTAKPVARRFDKVTVLCPFTGTPTDGLIMEGANRVKANPDKASI